MKIKIVNKSNFETPKYATEGSAGLDLRASIESPIELNPFDRVLVPTGIYVEIPQGHEGQIRGRSGLALNYGITLANGIGTIDSDYRGELKVILINLSEKKYIVSSGDRIAQLVFIKYIKADLVQADDLDKTKRGKNGFGHSGY